MPGPFAQVKGPDFSEGAELPEAHRNILAGLAGLRTPQQPLMYDSHICSPLIAATFPLERMTQNTWQIGPLALPDPGRSGGGSVMKKLVLLPLRRKRASDSSTCHQQRTVMTWSLQTCSESGSLTWQCELWLGGKITECGYLLDVTGPTLRPAHVHTDLHHLTCKSSQKDFYLLHARAGSSNGAGGGGGG